LKAQKIGVSLFIDPEPHQVTAAARLGAGFIELHTGHYARLADAEIASERETREMALSTQARRAHALRLRRHGDSLTLDGDAHRELDKLRAAAKLARSLKLRVNIGHGLNYFNVAPAAAIPGLTYAHIGHSIIARAIMIGMERAVREMQALITQRAGR
jgi:pyridoxine 5-phosphate synthase